MYLVSVIVLLFLAPAVSVLAEATTATAPVDILGLVGKWMTFWAVGIRLFTAGLRQNLQPEFTARDIFRIDDPKAADLVREIGLANLAMGALGIATYFVPAWLVPAAIVGGLYYGLAGLLHLMRSDRNANETIALVTDLLAFAILAVFVVLRGF